MLSDRAAAFERKLIGQHFIPLDTLTSPNTNHSRVVLTRGKRMRELRKTIINKHSTESVLRAAVLKLSDLFDVYTEKMELEYSVLGDSTIREYIDHEE